MDGCDTKWKKQVFTIKPMRSAAVEKTGRQQSCCRGSKNKAETPFLPRRTLSLQACSYALSHFLCSCSVFLHSLICCWLIESRVNSSLTLWWQWSTSLVGPREAAWSFDEVSALASLSWSVTACCRNASIKAPFLYTTVIKIQPRNTTVLKLSFGLFITHDIENRNRHQLNSNK